ncbi:MAG: DUF4159 domain-containing protein [Saprospiraceae bacterium]|nr:DUF4159 domain-containing protein [Saprospiraceae bacterium]
MRFLYIALFSFFLNISFAQSSLKIALVKYRGGGDWYSVVDALENISKFCNKELNMNLNPEYATVDIGSAEIYNYPFLFLTGHGNIVLSDEEAENIRTYLLSGGFLLIDDDFGIDPFIRPTLKKIFPDKPLVEIPFNHPIFNQKFKFPKGVPKIHQHDGTPPQTWGIMNEGRMVCLYLQESNISDGWESPSVHKDPEEVRQQALRMGANIIQFVFKQ